MKILFEIYYKDIDLNMLEMLGDLVFLWGGYRKDEGIEFKLKSFVFLNNSEFVFWVI